MLLVCNQTEAAVLLAASFVLSGVALF